MPWLKLGDLFATHPLLMRLWSVRGSDDRTLNEVSGFVARCASQSAAHMTDYAVDYGTAVLMGQGRTDLLLRQACEAGLMRSVGRGQARRWVITQDDDLLHVRAREDVLWERDRKRDLSNPDLTMPVRLRDGDVCRYCPTIVSWSSRTGGRSGTYDHRTAGERASSPADLVVACRSCNSARRDRENAETIRPLRPAPARPYFSPQSTSLAMLRKFYAYDAGHFIHTYTNPPRPGAESTGSDMEDHEAQQRTSSTWEAHDAAESTAPAWARPGTSPAGTPGAWEAHGVAERTNARSEARRPAGSTVAAEEAHARPDRKASHRRRKRRQRDQQDE